MKREYDYVVAGTLIDRSFLSDEMASLCAKLPIYRLRAVTKDESQLKSGVTVTSKLSFVQNELLLKRRERGKEGRIKLNPFLCTVIIHDFYNCFT